MEEKKLKKASKQLVTKAKKVPVTSREQYAGLHILPANAYDKFQVYCREKDRSETHFRCKYVQDEQQPDGEPCNKEFSKSTSLIVHYQRHINLRPFICTACNMSFTQSGTLVRHNRAIHRDAKEKAGDKSKESLEESLA